MVGLTDEKRGRRGRVRLTEEDVTWVEARAAEAPASCSNIRTSSHAAVL